MAAQELFTTTLFTDSNLISYYRFNNGATTTDSKDGNTLTNNNSVGENASGMFGYAADFTTVNSNKYLTTGNGLGVDLSSSAGAITFWHKKNGSADPSSGNRYRFIDWRSTTGTGRSVAFDYYNNGGTFQLSIYAMGNTITYNVTLTDTWHNFIFTWDSSGNCHLYFDGSSVATGTRGTAANGSNQTSIGSDIVGTSGFYTQGLMDDIAFFSRLLTSTEASEIYNGGLPVLGSGGLFFSQI